jgi:catechol 2,3-dioxygenase-like lactoylglutathione lyase family enzyme
VARTLRVVLNTSRFDDVVAFYRDALGLPVVGGWDRGPADRGALLEVAPGGVLEVVGHGPDRPPAPPPVIAVQLDSGADVDAVHDRLIAAGLPVGAPVLQSWGHRSVTARDPMGTEVVLWAEAGRPS